MGQSLASLWVPNDLQEAASTAIVALYDANRLIIAARSGTADDLIRSGVNLLAACNKAVDAVKPVVKELIDACRAIGEPVPVLNGVGDECVTGLAVAFANDAMNAYCDSYELATGFGMKPCVSPGTMPSQASRRIRRNLRSRELVDGENLRRLIDEEIRRAASIRMSAGVMSDAKPAKKRGRKPKYDPETDRKIVEAWNRGNGQHKDLYDVAKAFGMTHQMVELALGRHRKRLAERRKK